MGNGIVKKEEGSKNRWSDPPTWHLTQREKFQLEIATLSCVSCIVRNTLQKCPVSVPRHRFTYICHLLVNLLVEELKMLSLNKGIFFILCLLDAIVFNPLSFLFLSVTTNILFIWNKMKEKSKIKNRGWTSRMGQCESVQSTNRNGLAGNRYGETSAWSWRDSRSRVHCARSSTPPRPRFSSTILRRSLRLVPIYLFYGLNKTGISPSRWIFNPRLYCYCPFVFCFFFLLSFSRSRWTSLKS